MADDNQQTFEERKWAREQQIEEEKWKTEKRREDAHRAHDKSTEFHTYINQATIDAGSLALRTLVLINGGAAVAILAFLGAVASKDKIDFVQIGAVANTLKYYAAGVASAFVAMTLAYLTNYLMVSVETFKNKIYVHPFVVETDRSRKMARLNRIFHVLTLLASLGSLGCFVIGMWSTSAKVTSMIESRVTKP
ncbi:hypothetical protein [Bradyrhizobium japonicum]|uniref:hypothetical protein n=1 Tax=Bradyrhizobium japonicum TaxID=375 RepID=UPI001BAE5534|nr:hypothetical protein [Bradyrhizobium japonicum]MBR0962234.1 hypothetical protein [Bradyrhizobium japonicum]